MINECPDSGVRFELLTVLAYCGTDLFGRHTWCRVVQRLDLLQHRLEARERDAMKYLHQCAIPFYQPAHQL
jgi:hypothetical protein